MKNLIPGTPYLLVQLYAQHKHTMFFANQNGGLKYFEIFFVIILNITVFVAAAREGVYKRLSCCAMGCPYVLLSSSATHRARSDEASNWIGVHNGETQI